LRVLRVRLEHLVLRVLRVRLEHLVLRVLRVLRVRLEHLVLRVLRVRPEHQRPLAANPPPEKTPTSLHSNDADTP
ncbi:hypothetical protein, partial [Mycobacteroides abscessus]|uniref:hypothetical protein n=1 Tax=Mycobacteroides abscessus TaxID=36809 RepID=UPI001F3DE8A9